MEEAMLYLVGAAIVAVLVLFVRLIIKQRKTGIRYRGRKIFLLVVLVLLAGLYGFLDYRISLLNRMVYKPVIYLYPEEDTEVTVELGLPEQITVSYPLYKDCWKVTAAPDGNLKDRETGRELYALYYESESTVVFSQEPEGFVVKGVDTAPFLEEKLALLGLTDREAEEFIIYWLPILQENPYNYIRFALPEEIEANMPLSITPAPDTMLRILMTWKGLNRPVAVKEQVLTEGIREGFTAVEWGGTEIR